MAWLLLIAQIGNDAGGALCSTPPSAAKMLGLAAAHCSKSATTQAARSAARRHQQRGRLAPLRGRTCVAQDTGLHMLKSVRLPLVARRSATCSAHSPLADATHESSPVPFQGCPSPRVLVITCNGLEAYQGLQKAWPPVNLLATLRGLPQPARPVPPPPCLDGLLLGLYLRSGRHISLSNSASCGRMQSCSTVRTVVHNTAATSGHFVCVLLGWKR